jgi:hypothetical protein
MSEPKKLPGYSGQFRPKFYSAIFSFAVVLKNVYYADTDGQENDFGINLGLNEIQQNVIKLLINNPMVTTLAAAVSPGLTRRRRKIISVNWKKPD